MFTALKLFASSSRGDSYRDGGAVQQFCSGKTAYAREWKCGKDRADKNRMREQPGLFAGSRGPANGVANNQGAPSPASTLITSWNVLRRGC